MTGIAVLLVLVSFLSSSIAQTYRFHTDGQSAISQLQIKSDGTVFTTLGSQLLKLNSQLSPVQNVTLASSILKMTLVNGEKSLIVCISNGTCAVYNANDLSSTPQISNVTLPNDATIALFSSGTNFYIGSSSAAREFTFAREDVTGENMYVPSSKVHSIEKKIFESRQFLYGFNKGDCSYFVVYDKEDFGRGVVYTMRVIRTCHNSSCCSSSSECSFTSISEDIIYGGSGPDFKNICGVTAIQNYRGESGLSVVVSVCSEGSVQKTDTVCSIEVNDIDNNMNQAYDICRDQHSSCVSTAWSSKVECNSLTFSGRDCISAPIGDDIECISTNIVFIPERNLFHLSSSDQELLSSVPITLDGLSFLAISYNYSEQSFVGLMQVGENIAVQQGLQNLFYAKQTSSPVHELKWANGLDHVVAASESEIFTFPLEECSVHRDCSSCVSDRNPLCGWCVVENKCSRVSQCDNSSSVHPTSWIRSNPSNPFCVLSDKLVLQNQQQVHITVFPVRMPQYNRNLSYSCLLENVNGQQAISIPATAIEVSGSYECNLSDSQVPEFNGVKSDYTLKFQSLEGTALLERSSVVLSVFNCTAAKRCGDCLSSKYCGWCMETQMCTSTPSSCSSQGTLQISEGQHFQDMCPIVLKDNGANYVQPVRIPKALQVKTKNLPVATSPYDYKCRIGQFETTAEWRNETAIDCIIQPNQITIINGTLTTSVQVFWTGPMVQHEIDTLEAINVELYDCQKMASDCSSCLENMTNYPCSWCQGDDSKCSIAEECTSSRSSLITVGKQCPAPNITSFSPINGPLEGGTIITIRGTDLGVSIDDFDSIGSIKIGDIPCIPLLRDYISGEQVLCRTSNMSEVGLQELMVTLTRVSGPVKVTAPMMFEVFNPTVISVSPPWGPIAGGSVLIIRGRNFDIGNGARVTLYGYDGPRCNILSRNATVITCETIQVSAAQNKSGFVVVHVDEHIVADPTVMFQYRPNPEFVSVHPQSAIPSLAAKNISTKLALSQGGVMLTFTGRNLNVTESPKLSINSSVHPCSNINGTAIGCIIPKLKTPVNQDLVYSLELDNSMFPVLSSNPQLQVRVKSDPGSLKLVTKVVTLDLISSSNFVLMQGKSLQSVAANEFLIQVGGHKCGNISVTSDREILCMPPQNPALNNNGEAEVMVHIGTNLRYTLDSKLRFVRHSSSTAGISGMNPLYLLPFLFIPILLLCSIAYLVIWFCLRQRKTRRKGFYNVTTKEFHIVQEEVKQNTYDDTLGVSGPRRKQTKSSADLMDEMTSQLPRKLIIAQEQLQVLDIPLGQGQFGMVFKGNMFYEVDGKNASRDVAVKSFKGLMSSDVRDIFAEIFKMQDLAHANVMALVGVCISVIRGPCIVMPFMKNGSLLHYLKKERRNIHLKFDVGEDTIASVKKLLLRMCHEIALGMEYLASNQIVHRDLAARNCLLDSEGSIKVSDFGLSEDIYVSGYFRQNKNDSVKLPFKWMAPESMRDGIFSHKSDVWSYGVTCWEIFSAGRTPYPGVDAIDLFRYLEDGVRLENPHNAASDDDIYSLMLMCWEADPQNRPTFQDLPSLVTERLDPISEYMEMNMLLQPYNFDEYEEMSAITGYEGARANIYNEDIEMEIKEVDATESQQIKLDCAQEHSV